MEHNQTIRGLAILVAGAGYYVRVLVVGNGPVEAFGHAAAPFVLFLGAVIVLALPETIDRLPFGPTRD